MNETIKLLLYFSSLIAISVIGALVIYRRVSHTLGTRVSSWNKGAKNILSAKMVYSSSVISGELNHRVWADREVIEELQSNLESKTFFGIEIITSFIDYYTLIEPSTNKGTSMLEWLVCGKIKIYEIPEEINSLHFRIIDNNIVIFHKYDTGTKGEEIIIKGIKPVVEKFETKFKELRNKAHGPFKGEDIINKFEIRKLVHLAKDEWENIKNDERKVLEKEINKLIGV